MSSLAGCFERWRVAPRRVLAWLLALAAALSLLAPAWGQGRLVLSDDERAYLQRHSPLRVATKQDWAPIDTYSYEGQYRGLSGEFLHLIEQRLGLRFQYLALPTLADGLQALQDGRADIVPSVSRTPQRAAYMRFSRPYLDVPNIYLARRGVPAVGENEAMAGLRVAAERGYAVIGLIRERHPRATIVEFDDSAAALRGVSEGRADVYLGALPTTTFLVEKLLLTNLEIRAPWRTEFSALHLGVRSSDPMLQAILDKALDSIGLKERQEIHRRWVPLRTLLAEPAPPLPLSDEERRFLAQMPALRVAFDEAHHPYTFRDASGQPAGMAVDYLHLLTRRLGLSVGPMQGGTWSEAYAAARAGQADLLIAVAENEERRREFAFVGPWISTPTVLVTRADAASVFSLREMDGRTVAVLANGQHKYLLGKHRPGVRLLELPTREALLTAVAQGQVDGAVSNVSFVVPRLQEGLGAGLKIAGVFPELNTDLYFAVRRDQPQLAALLTRALDSVTDAERATIGSRWAVIQPQVGPTAAEVARRVAPWAAALLLALAVAVGWALSLRRQVARTRAAEQALAVARDRAEALAQARADFITIASHEIRTPVNAVNGALDLLGREALTAAQRELLALARRAAATLSEFVNNLLDLSKSDAGQLQIHVADDDVGAALTEVVDTLRQGAEHKGLVLALDIDPALAPRLRTDSLRLRQVVMNLVSNAIKFTPAGRVDVRLRVQGEPEGAQRLLIEVADTGVGIPADRIDGLFRPYEQAHASAAPALQGTGLGLVLCKRLVEAMGGTITLESTEGQGTVARVGLTLPLGRPAGADGAPGPTGLPATGEGLRVLVIDDDRVQQIVLTALLVDLGCQVDVADNGLQGLALWQRHRHTLVFTDCRMPVMGGPEFTRRLHALPGGAAVQVIGTSADLDDADEALASGMLRLLPKPVSRAMLADLIGAVA